jgi:hypothetical protein
MMANAPEIYVERTSPGRAGQAVSSRSSAPRSAPLPERTPVGGRIAETSIISRPALPEADRVGDAVDRVARQAGRVVGYLRSRTPAEMRADAERVIVDNGALALVAALGLGYLVGRQVRR